MVSHKFDSALDTRKSIQSAGNIFVFSHVGTSRYQKLKRYKRYTWIADVVSQHRRPANQRLVARAPGSQLHVQTRLPSLHRDFLLQPDPHLPAPAHAICALLFADFQETAGYHGSGKWCDYLLYLHVCFLQRFSRPHPHVQTSYPHPLRISSFVSSTAAHPNPRHEMN